MPSFFFGGIGCMVAASITHPIDTIKTRLQLQGSALPLKYDGFFKGILTLVREEGFSSLYRGLSASLLREATYSTIRMGLYDPIKKLISVNNQKETLLNKMLAGGLSGLIGAAIANPTDLLKIRMQADHGSGNHPLRLYSLATGIVKKEGIRGLYHGVIPTCQRALILTAFQLSSYDHTKQLLLESSYLKEGMPLHFVSSMVAGFVCATASAPVDTIKSRYMNQHFHPSGMGVLYSSSFDCFRKTLLEGPLALFKGWVPQWLRLGPHSKLKLTLAMITFIVVEQLRLFSGFKPM